jgi:hypothetical protein
LLAEFEGASSADELSEYTGSSAALDQVEKWLDTCESDHSECAPGRRPKQRANEAAEQNGEEQPSPLDTSFLPKRLLEIGTRPNDPIRLIETGTGTKRISGRYMTLSYCWGPPPWFRLMPDNAVQFAKEAKWSESYRTFTHIVRLARKLKIRYIWIDAICILQDGIEFQIEGQTMDLVYGNSVLNVAAAASKDSTGGLFRKRSRQIRHELVFEPVHTRGSKMLSDGTWRIFSGDMWEHQLLQEHLYQRAWVFQERYLSPRLVHFASKQIFWDCARLSACETFPYGLPQPLDTQAAIERHWRERLQHLFSGQPNQQLVGAADDSPEELWRTAVHSYTSCALTNANDKLLAIWGVAKLVKETLKENYAAGMWQNNLHEQLAWRVADCTELVRMELIQGKKVPSWSWASITAKKSYDGAKILLPDRLDSLAGRFKVARDHDGKFLAFKVQENAGLQPELLETKLPIQGRIFKLFPRRDGNKWTAKFEGSTQSQFKIELFPDTQPKPMNEDEEDEVEQEFTLNMESDRRSYVQDSQDDFAIVIACSQPEGSLEYHGFGLTMQYMGATIESLFRRTGLFRFHGHSEKEWEFLDRTCSIFCDTSAFDTNEDGVKFWLE